MLSMISYFVFWYPLSLIFSIPQRLYNLSISDFWFIILQRSLFSNPILDHLSFLLYARWLNLSLSLNYFIFLLFLHSVTRWLDHLLKIWLFYYKEKWPNSKFLLPKQVQNLPNTNQTLKILPKASRILPKWRNFTKSGHTDPHSAISISSQYLFSIRLLHPFSSISISLYPSPSILNSLSLCFSLSLSLYLSFSLSLYLSLSPSFSLFLSLFPSFSLSLHLSLYILLPLSQSFSIFFSFTIFLSFSISLSLNLPLLS